uniref:Fibrinogen C-terminal domain-containing protein n=1 Tax=Biomphalaria glabrata TaxID=6526 RepID=A0A2C9JBM8_BIOGL
MALLLHLALWASLVSLSTSELLIDVQPNVISEELTPKLVINCSISNNQVQQIDMIKSLSLARYNENIKEFEVLYYLEAATLNLTQHVQFQRSQIGFGNKYITLTLQEPTQSDARVYRCNVIGDNAKVTNISVVSKKEVRYETISTPLIDEIRRLKKEADKNQCSSTNGEITDNKKKVRSKLSFVGSSEVINEFIEPFTLTCSCQVSNLHPDTNYTVEFMYILHETNGVIATINKGQLVVTAIQDFGNKNVKGELSDTKLQDSYLRVTWKDLKSSDSGKYFCGAHVIDAEGRSERLNEMVTVKVKLPTFDDLVNVIQKLLILVYDDREILQDNEQNIKSIQNDLSTNVLRINKDLDNYKENFIRINTDLDSKQQNIINIKQDLDNQKLNIIRINEDLDSKEQQFTQFNIDLDSKQQTIIRIDKDLNATEHSIIRIDKDLNATEHSIIRINKDLNATEHSIIRIDKDLNATEHSIIRINKDLDSKQQTIFSIQQDCKSTKKDFNEYKQNMSIFKETQETVFLNLSSSLTEVKQEVEKVSLELSDGALSTTGYKHTASCRQVRSIDSRVIVLLASELQVMCDTKTDGGGWIIFQRRINGKVDFYRGWKEYRDGFGDYNIGEFYLGSYKHIASCQVRSIDSRVIVLLISGLKVMCDTKTDGGGWIIFQRRINGKVDFYRGWKEYRDGFGDYNIGEFYLGNEIIFNLTSTGKYDLRIDLEFNNTKYFAQYKDFKVLSETEKYKLQIGNYLGNASNQLFYHNNTFFTTYDSDNDESRNVNCAVDSSGAWWYYWCHDSNLNGKWGSKLYKQGMNWYGVTEDSNSVSFTEMKIRERE